MPEKQREAEFDPSAVPEDITVTEPSRLQSGDYSYTADLIGSMQNQLGKLTQAVESLTEQSREHGNELKNLSRQIYAAKVAAGVLGGLLLLIGSFIAWIVNAYISTRPIR